MSDGVTIKTNNVPRDIIDAYELTPAERAEFDYLDWPAIDDGRDSASFVRYRGQLIDIGTFERTEVSADSPFAGWDGCVNDSFFSGTLIRLVDNGERAIIGSYYA
jgi:hypothetical protein